MSLAKSRGIVFGLAKSDLKHEWILTVCLVMAVAAVLSPLLLLFGLKYGTIATLRHRQVEDPRNREIRPMVAKSFTRDWVEAMRKRPDVAFVVPTTRQISATVDVQSVKGGPKAALDIAPTQAGDPLLLENGSPVPKEGECVLTYTAAEELKLKPGDQVTAKAKRIKGSRYESAELKLTVAGVLTPRGGVRKMIFVHLPVLEAVEAFKDGRAVPEYGWPGATAGAYPVYDGVVAALPQALDKLGEVMLINNTGFTRISKPSAQELSGLTGFKMGDHMQLYLLATRTKPVGEESLGAVKGKLRGKGATLLPTVKPMPADLLGPDGKKLAEISLAGLSVDPAMAADLKVEPTPPWGKGQGEFKDLSRIMLPQGMEQPAGPYQIRLTKGKEKLTIPVTVLAERNPASTSALAPAALAGMLNLFSQRNLGYEEQTGQLVLARRGYAGFRMYAATIDDVPVLKDVLESKGIGVHTEAERIRDVIELDTYLTLIFWLIAVVGIVGGMASLVASLYASVERKKRELAVLRLLGLSGGKLFRFPIYQGMVIALGGYLVAMAFFQTLAAIINSLFAQHLQEGESFCTLPWLHALTALAATLGIAILAATLAAWRVTRIEPAEALRDE
jgi:putative ABC transport system permease protein